MPCIKPKTTSKFKSVCSSLFKKNQRVAGIEYAQSAIKTIVLAFYASMTVALITGCSNRRSEEAAPRPIPAPEPVFTPRPDPAPVPPPVGISRLPTVASWADYRRRAAQLILASNPGASFTGTPPVQWSGIATVTVMINADGSIRALDLMRGSRISPQVNDLALAAVRRAANYGPVGSLPQPWQFNETFLYNNNNKFQLVTIVENR